MQKSKLNVLCLSFYTPPVVRPQAILIGKMIPEWIRQGLEPVVITYDGEGDWDIGAPVYKIPQFKISKFFNIILPLRSLLKYLYDERIFFFAKKIIRQNGVDIIFSFSNPQESNVLGAKLGKKLNIPFISHFSDPWYDNPYKTFSGLKARKVLWQERSIVENSNKVIFTNEVARGLIMKKYPNSWAKKAEVIPHCFNLKDYPEVYKTDSGKFIISYIGAFYEKRNPELLFKALQKIMNKRTDFTCKFKIELIGAANGYAGYSIESIKEMAGLYGLKDNIEIIPPVSYEESLKYMKLADCLVVIDANMPGSPFLPSKVVDYAGSGKAILGITPINSPTAQFIKSLGYESFNYDQVDKLAQYLERLISGKIKIGINKEYLEQYDVQYTTAKLIKLFNEVLEN